LQIAHDEWRAGLSEAERVLARLKPVSQKQLYKMTKEQQLDSRWLSNTYRAPKGPKKVLDPVEKAAAYERDKKAAAKKEALRSEQEIADRKLHKKEVVAATKLRTESGWTEGQKHASPSAKT
jgi:hypothetical protein